MRARAIVASVVVWACTPGCVSTQDLGAWSSGNDAGEAGSSVQSDPDPDPHQGFVGNIANRSCPPSVPAKDEPCGAASGECLYETVDLEHQTDRTVCGRSCVCAYGGKWICVDAHCPELDVANCHEGVACVGDVQCSARYDALKGVSQRCVCRGGRMACGPQEGPPR